MYNANYTFKVVGEDMGGSLVLLEALVPPQGGPPPHIHHAEDEFFWLLEEELEFLANGRTFMANAGSFVYFPKGTTHRFKSVGTQTARMLAAFMPPEIEGPRLSRPTPQVIRTSVTPDQLTS